MTSQLPRADIEPNTLEYETIPLVKATGFREYDARWILEKEINLLGIQALGLGLGTLIHQQGVKPRIVVGHDFRSYSLSVKQALMLGLVSAGCEVLDIGLAVSPMAYFAQFDLDAPCVAMVTASHNENGWTGVKMGSDKPKTFGPEQIGPLKDHARRPAAFARDNVHQPGARQDVDPQIGQLAVQKLDHVDPAPPGPAVDAQPAVAIDGPEGGIELPGQIVLGHQPFEAGAGALGDGARDHRIGLALGLGHDVVEENLGAVVHPVRGL